MEKILLIESITIDALDKQQVVERKDLFESFLVNKNPLHESVSCLGVYTVPISRLGLNKNKRTYDEQTWAPVLEKHLGEGSLGLMDHPLPSSSGGPPVGSVKDVFAVWRNHRWGEDSKTGDKVVLADMFLADNNWGKHVKSILECGGKLDLSTRGYGQLTPENKVRDYQYNSTDCVLVGSANVRFGSESAVNPSRLPENVKVKNNLTEEIKETKKENKEQPTNNKPGSLGESIMNKLFIKKMIEEAMGKTPAVAYFELEEMLKDIKEDASLTEQVKDIQSKLDSLKSYITESEMGGSATSAGYHIYPGTTNKIQDTKEKEPNMVDSEQVEPLEDTPDSERTKSETKYKAGGSKTSRRYEVMSGNQMESTDIEITPDTEVFEDEEGQPFVETESGERYYIDVLEAAQALGLIELDEDTKEKEPEMVEPIQVEPLKDSRTVKSREQSNEIEDSDTGAITVKSGSGKQPVKEEDETENLFNLNKMNKDELIDVAVAMSESINELKKQIVAEQSAFEELSGLYNLSETWSLMNEKVLEGDVQKLQEAQQEVNEAVEYAKELKEQLEKHVAELTEVSSYVEQLENAINESSSKEQENTQVLEWVNQTIVANPSLAVWENELKKCKTLHEARMAISKYSGMGSKIRLDVPLVESKLEASGVPQVSEARRSLTTKGWI